MPEVNFGYGGSSSGSSAGATEGQTDGNVTDINNGNDSLTPPDINDGNNGELNKNNGTEDVNKNNGAAETEDGDNNNGGTETTLPHDYEAGTEIEVDGSTYSVAENGDVVDKDGNVFKEAKDVKAWIESFEVNNVNPDEISIETLQKTFDVELTDENGKPIEFENTPEGVKSYVESIIEVQREEIQEATINTLYAKYPILETLIPYIATNGGSIEGFTDVKDRSGVTIDESNEAQQESIIRESWAEQKISGNVDNYIAYLKANGMLLGTAKAELAALQEKDVSLREELAQQAEEAEQAAIERETQFWTGVKEVIDSRSIAGYKIPDTIIIERDGKKISATPDDFFNYMYQVDANGKSRYDNDLAKESLEDRRNDAILRAYLKFVGGNYTNLVDMAINDKEVKKLKLIAKSRNQSSVKVNKPQTNKGKDIDLGFK
jgi:hypothetical protein